MQLTQFSLIAFTILASFLTHLLACDFLTQVYGHELFLFSFGNVFYSISFIASVCLAHSRLRARPKITLVWGVLLFGWIGVLVPILKMGIVAFGDSSTPLFFYLSGLGLLTGLFLKNNYGKLNSINSISPRTVFAFTSILLLTVYTIVYGRNVLPQFGTATRGLSSLGIILNFLFLLTAKNKMKEEWLLLVLSGIFPWAMHSISRLYLYSLPGPSPSIVWEEQGFRDKMVFMESKSETDFPGLPEHTLYRSGLPSFRSGTEQNFHACLVNVPLSAADFVDTPIRNVLVLGGGEGFVARNLVNLPRIKSIQIVDAQPSLTAAAKEELKFRMYNLDSLKSSKVKSLSNAPLDWLFSTTSKYDLILMDLPEPKDFKGAQVYSAEFLRRALSLLQPNGFAAIAVRTLFDPESTNILSRRATSCLETITSLGYRAYAYFNSREREGFVLVTTHPKFDMGAFARKMKMIDNPKASHVCRVRSKWEKTYATRSTIISPQIFYAGREQNDYKGRLAVLLPD